jgi:hypothetical protein
MTRVLALLLVSSALVISPSIARADFGFAPGSPTVRALDSAGEPFAEAGGHPDRLKIAVTLNSKEDIVEGNLKDIDFDFPPGFSGDPNAVPACPRRVFDGGQSCEPKSQVGVIHVKVNNGLQIFDETVPLFSVEPAPGEPAVVGFGLLFSKSPLVMRVRSDDFGVRIEQHNVVQTLPLIATEVELWGIPADHQDGTGIPRRPFLTLPTRCDRGPLSITARARSWQQPERTVTATGDTGVPLMGCETLPFAPALSFDLANSALDSPTGAALRIDMPLDESPDGRSSSAAESVEIALPAGVSISPGVAAGLSTCADQDLHLGSDAPAACPASAKIGTVELVAPQTREPLQGSIFLGQEHTGERFRLFIVAEGMGVAAKFVGALRVDPGSGRITAALDRLPEVAVSHIGLRFDDGPRALLATPLTCGPLTATGKFKRYGDSRTVQSADVAVVDHGVGGQACPGAPPFHPRFDGGATSARAGRASGLSLTLHRESGEQLPDRFSTTLPPGLSAAVGSVDVCGAAAAATGACPAGSRVGSAIGEVGSGPNPARMGGDVFLTGRYRRAPFGLALVFHAAIGPFDLGTIVTRAALRMDATSGQVSVETDSLPAAVEGIPIRFQTIGIDVDRPGFIHNPTSCDDASVDTLMRSTTGASSLSSSPFVIRGCDALRFAPRFSMQFADRTEMRRGGSPGLRIGIRLPRGGANLSSADIALPESVGLDPAALQQICARQDALEGACPDSSRVGSAGGETPLSSKRLSGSVHVVQPRGSGPPELWTSLEGLGTRLDLRGEMHARGGRLHAELVGLPDFPLSKFTMRLNGGKRGILSFGDDPCSAGDRRQRARVAFEGQNRAYLIRSKRIVRPGCGGSAPAPSARSPRGAVGG